MHAQRTPTKTAQELLHHVENGQLGIHLCPRAALTGETPCGHHVRAWAVLAPVPKQTPAGASLVSASGLHLTNATNASTMSSLALNSTAATNTMASLTGLANTGTLFSGLYNTGANNTAESNAAGVDLAWRWGAASHVSGFALRPSGRAGGTSGAAPRGGERAERGAFRRARLTEAEATAETNLSGAMLMSGLFSGTGVTVEGSGGGYGTTGGGAWGAAATAMSGFGTLTHTLRGSRTMFGATLNSIVNRCVVVVRVSVSEW